MLQADIRTARDLAHSLNMLPRVTKVDDIVIIQRPDYDVLSYRVNIHVQTTYGFKSSSNTADKIAALDWVNTNEVTTFVTKIELG